MQSSQRFSIFCFIYSCFLKILSFFGGDYSSLGGDFSLRDFSLVNDFLFFALFIHVF